MVAAGKVALLDAAEAVFAEHGFFGAGMRDISKLANVPHGLITYHFDSKVDLFRQVIGRRANAFARALEQALANAIAAGPSVRSILQAFVMTHVELAGDDAGWRNYFRLAQQSIALGERRELLVQLAEQTADVTARYRTQLRAELPHVSSDAVDSRFYMMQLLLAGILVDTQPPPPIARLHEAGQELVAFCAAGFAG